MCAGAKPKEHTLDLHLQHGEKWSVRYMSSMRWVSKSRDCSRAAVIPLVQAPVPCRGQPSKTLPPHAHRLRFILCRNKWALPALYQQADG